MDAFVYQSTPVRVVFGNGASQRLGEEAGRLKMSRMVVLCSPARAALAERLAETLGQGAATVCDASAANMPQAAYDRVMADMNAASADGLVALGGGSPIGLGKAVAAATGLPLIAVATTYSGSEMASNWYVGAGAARRVGKGPEALPRTVIYDPELTLGLAPATSAASGMNAMAHAVESLYGPDTNPVIQALATEAIARLGAALPRIVDDPANLDARGEALYGAWLAAAFRATSGLEHIIAQGLRRRFGLGHAAAHAAVLPYAVAFNAPATPDAMARIGRALGVEDAARGLYELNRTLGISTGLGGLGLTAGDLDDAVEAVADAKFANPRTVSRAGFTAVIAQAIAGAPPYSV